MSYDQHSPYQPTGLPVQPPKRGSGMTVLWIILGAVVGLVLVCGCCGGGMWWLTTWSVNEYAGGKVARKLEQSDSFREQYGEFERLEWNIVQSGEYMNKQGEESVFAYDAYGSKGRCLVYAKFDDDGEELIWVKMETPSGELVDVFPQMEAAEAAEAPN